MEKGTSLANFGQISFATPKIYYSDDLKTIYSFYILLTSTEIPTIMPTTSFFNSLYVANPTPFHGLRNMSIFLHPKDDRKEKEKQKVLGHSRDVEQPDALPEAAIIEPPHITSPEVGSTLQDRRALHGMSHWRKPCIPKESPDGYQARRNPQAARDRVFWELDHVKMEVTGKCNEHGHERNIARWKGSFLARPPSAKDHCTYYSRSRLRRGDSLICHNGKTMYPE